MWRSSLTNEGNFSLPERIGTEFPIFKFRPVSNPVSKERSIPDSTAYWRNGSWENYFHSGWFSRFETESSINSPTFSLYNIYDSPKFRLYHFDLYRIKFPEELDELGFEEIWGKDGVSAIEWWQIAEPYLPKTNRILLSIESDSIDFRSYTLEWSENEIL